MTEPGPDGLSAFQRETESAISEMIAGRSLTIDSREVIRTAGGAEDYLVLKIGKPSMTIWVYRDQVDVEAPADELRLEEWDVRTPEEHRARVLAFLDSQI